MASYNGLSWIEAQVASILSQVAVDVHLVVSDDGSKDGTLNVLERFHLAGKLTLFRSEVSSGSAAQNFLRLIRLSPVEDHSFIAFSDQDDIWDSNKLARAVRLLTESGAAAYSTWVDAFWPDGRRSVLRQSSRTTRSDFLFESAGQGCTYLLTAGFYQRVQKYVSMENVMTTQIRYHDWLIYALSRCWDLTWVFDSVPMVSYRQHDLNDTGAKTSIEGVLKRFRLLRSGWYVQQINRIQAVCAAVDPAQSVVSEWSALSSAPDTMLTRWRKVNFICKGGRRRKSDNFILTFAAVIGWV